MGDQLFPIAQAAFQKKDLIFMAEDYELCTHYKYHKSKLVFFLTAMREYAQELKKKKWQVIYYSGQHSLFKNSYFNKLEKVLKDHPSIKEVHYYTVSDRFFNRDLASFLKKSQLKFVEHPSPMFLTTEEEYKTYLKQFKKPFMMTFYMEQRRRLNLLVDSQGRPEGGKWSFDTKNRKKYPKDIQIPKMISHKTTNHLQEVKIFVDETFPKHPGSTANFWLPVNRKQALHWLDQFITEKIQSFGPYEDAIKANDVFGFHSVLSPMINCGMLTPNEIVEKLVETSRTNKIPLASVEGFIRQIIGWREFMKGIYDNYINQMEEKNFWGHKRQIKKSWYLAQTGLRPLDDSIAKVQKYGYAHHIERLMIQSNIMLLCEIEPKVVHRWFMEMYVDSADWVMAGNVYAMGQMSEGGIFSTKPYTCGSNYILKMSDYKKEDWCLTLDGLYWRFIHKHKKVFAKNPRMSMMVKVLERMDKNRWEELNIRAENFLEEHTLPQ